MRQAFWGVCEAVGPRVQLLSAVWLLHKRMLAARSQHTQQRSPAPAGSVTVTFWKPAASGNTKFIDVWPELPAPRLFTLKITLTTAPRAYVLQSDAVMLASPGRSIWPVLLPGCRASPHQQQHTQGLVRHSLLCLRDALSVWDTPFKGP